jgi:hypothetical protein
MRKLFVIKSPMKPTDYPFWFRLVVVVVLALTAINLFFFLVPLTALLAAASQLITGRGLLTGLGTLSATFIGAWLAFKFATLKSERERIDNEVAAGNRALFTLSWMWNEIRQHQKEIIDPYRDKPDAWFNLHVSPPLNSELSLDMKELSFVMESNASVFQQVFLEEERFRLAAHLIEEHKQLICTQTWPRDSAATESDISSNHHELRRE